MVHTVVKREQITIVDTGTAVLIQRLETSSWVHNIQTHTCSMYICVPCLVCMYVCTYT